MDGKNRLYFADNLKILRDHVADASVDLIYLDPPFNSNATYNVLFKEGLCMPCNILLLLPIHRRTYTRYYADHDKYVSEEKRRFERESGLQYKETSEDFRRGFEDRRFWPPWLVNDVVGFLMIGPDWGDEDDVVGTIFLRRKHFPRTSHERGQGTVIENQQLLYYGQTQRQTVEPLESGSYLNAVARIIKETKASVRRRVRGAEIWLPPFSLDCLDLAKAHDQLKQRTKPS
jgi:hypothetical protein